MRQNENRCNFHPRKDGDHSGFVFSEEWCQTAFLQFGYHFRGKYAGVQRGEAPWLWVSNRGEKHPCWHTILLAKSSVLYLLRPLTLERGCHHTGQTLFGGSRTGGFCGLKGTQNEGFSMSKIRLFVCSCHRKSCSCAERFSVPTGEQEVYKTRRSDQLPYRIFACSNSKGIVNFFGSSLIESFRI